MFTPLPGRTSIGIGPDLVVAIIESINAPNISIPETGTEPTKAFLIGFATPNGGYGIFCYLLQLDSNRPIMYISNPPEVAFDQYASLEADAIQFAESMGFMLDNTNFRAQPPDVQARMVAELPFFRDAPPKPQLSRAGTQPAPILGVGNLLQQQQVQQMQQMQQMQQQQFQQQLQQQFHQMQQPVVHASQGAPVDGGVIARLLSSF